MGIMILHNRFSAAIAILSCCIVLATTVLAAPGSDANGHSAMVIAHLPLPGPSATQMLLQRQNGKLYLYVDQGGTQDVAVVDVTSPSRPNVVDHVAWPGDIADGEIQRVGSGLALSEVPERHAMAPSTTRTPQTVTVVDLADPGHPLVLETFAGVTSTLPDTARNLIFIANSDGVWVVRHREGQSAYAMRHRCTSEAALDPEPDCY